MRPNTEPTAWRVFRLLERHPIGLTRREICSFAGLEPGPVAEALAQLQRAGAIAPEGYVRVLNDPPR